MVFVSSVSAVLPCSKLREHGANLLWLKAFGYSFICQAKGRHLSERESISVGRNLDLGLVGRNNQLPCETYAHSRPATLLGSCSGMLFARRCHIFAGKMLSGRYWTTDQGAGVLQTLLHPVSLRKSRSTDVSLMKPLKHRRLRSVHERLIKTTPRSTTKFGRFSCNPKDTRLQADTRAASCGEGRGACFTSGRCVGFLLRPCSAEHVLR